MPTVTASIPVAGIIDPAPGTSQVVAGVLTSPTVTASTGVFALSASGNSGFGAIGNIALTVWQGYYVEVRRCSAATTVSFDASTVTLGDRASIGIVQADGSLGTNVNMNQTTGTGSNTVGNRLDAAGTATIRNVTVTNRTVTVVE